ncbi:MAG: AAA family ATPase [Oscillospiraceae bacterium]|nr:AAA family ATPase [Oscillospiraceae bacterium]
MEDDREEFKDSDLFIQSLEIEWSKINKHSYLHGIKSVRRLTELEFTTPITIFTGENGSGKSTLLEAIAIKAGFNAEGGTFNYSFSTFDSHSDLNEAIHLIRGYRRPDIGYFLRAESFYNVATMDEYYGSMNHGVPHDYHYMSHGQSFLKTMEVNFKENGLFILDEPEAALSLQNQMALLVRLIDIAAHRSQIIMATHSPILLAVPDARILLFDDDSVHDCAYAETPSYQITKRFVNDTERTLGRLLEK